MRFSCLHVCQDLNQEQSPNSMFLWGKQSFTQRPVCSTVFRNALSEKLDCLMSCKLILAPQPPAMFPREGLASQKELEVHSGFCLVALGRLVYISKFLFNHLPRSNDDRHLMVGKDSTVARNAGVAGQLNKRLWTDWGTEHRLWLPSS